MRRHVPILREFFLLCDRGSKFKVGRYQSWKIQILIPAEDGGQDKTRMAKSQNNFNGSNSVFMDTYCQYLTGSRTPLMLFLKAEGGKMVES